MSDVNSTAVVTADTTVIDKTGHGFTLQPGRYEVVDIDGAAARGFVAIVGPVNGELLLVNPNDPNIRFEKN